jgi:CRISPR/Cas system-associated protein Cas10 (large subunit of type III CRISPR-Cas system)
MTTKEINKTELKKLIEQIKKEMNEQGEPTVSARKTPRSSTSQSVTADADTKIKSATPTSPSGNIQYQNPQDFFKGMRRLYIKLQDKFLFEMKNKEISDIIQEIFQEQANELAAQHPEIETME